MNKKFLIKGKSGNGVEAKFSPAEMHLATNLRTLKSFYSNKDDKQSFFKHFMAEVNDMAFTKSEVARIWKAMHVVAYYDADSCKHVVPMSADHKLFFPVKCYRNNSNFFENYAHQLLEEGDIVQQRGRVKGKIYPRAHSRLDITCEVNTTSAEEQKTPVEDTPIKTNLFNGLSLNELKDAQSQLAKAIEIAEAEEKRKADIRNQYETLRAAADKLLAENPWLN